MNKIDKFPITLSKLETMLKECSDSTLSQQIRATIQEFKKNILLNIQFSAINSSQTILTNKSLELLCIKNYTIPKDLNTFDDYSIDLVKMVVNINNNTNVKALQLVLSRFNGDQMNRHLDNFLNFLFFKNYKNKDVEKIVKSQLSLIESKHLIEGVKKKNGVDPNRFFEDFFLILKASNSLEDVFDPNTFQEKIKKFYDWIQDKYGELNEVLFGDLKNMIIADDIISSQVPSSIWNAQGVLGTQLAKSQSLLPLSGPPTMVLGMAVAAGMIPFSLPLAVLIGAFGLVPLGIPPLLSLTRKVYLQWFLNAPLSLEPLSDYTKKNRDYTIDFIGREEVFKKILNIWKQGKHPILVGAPGTGKTTIFMELGRLIANGAIEELKGKTLYAGSAALLMGDNGMNPPMFPRIVEVLQHYKKNVILALDEVHALAEDKKVFSLLRSVTDGSKTSLPYCLFATTPEEYEKTIAKDDSLLRRLTKIDIKALNKNDLLNLLQKEAKVISPQISINEEALIKIYDAADGLQNESRQLLHRIVIAAESINMDHWVFQERYEKKSELNLKKSLFKSESNDIKETILLSREIEQINEELILLEDHCNDRKQVQEKHIKMRANLIEQKNKLVLKSKLFFKGFFEKKEKNLSNEESIQKLKSQTFHSEDRKEEIKNLIFNHYYSCSHSITLIRTIEKIHGLISQIDKGFVENFIKHSEKEKKERGDNQQKITNEISELKDEKEEINKVQDKNTNEETEKKESSDD
jgi:hypothetical protein